jgi:hypothetical protein
MKWLGIMFMAALLTIAPGYGSAQPPKDTTPAAQPQGSAPKAEPAVAVKSFTPAERQDYQKKTAKELEAVQQKITDLRVKAATGAPQRKRMLMKTANDLQFQKMAAQNKLTALEKAPETAWGEGKADLDKAMQGLREALGTTGVRSK